MKDWQTARLGDFVTFQRGVDITRATQVDGDVPVVSSGGISSYHNQAISEGPGVIIGRKGTLGKTFYLNRPYWPHDTTLWVKDFRSNFPRFVYYFMSKFDVSWLDAGSANPTLNRNHLHPLMVTWPPVSEQQAIAEVLGALDDKIAINAEAAQKAVQIVDAKFAMVRSRAALTFGTFGEAVNVGGGGTPSTKVPEYWGGDVHWATPTDVTGLGVPYLATTGRTLTSAGLAHCSSPVYEPGSILMTSRATIGAFAIAREPMAVNQGFIVANAVNPIYQWWLFHEMRTRVPDFVAHANGATFLELSRTKFKNLSLGLPVSATATLFGSEAEPLHSLAWSLMHESTRLANLRDALLPELMSGRLRVKDAERTVEEVI